MIKKIESLTNPEIVAATKLKNKKYRDQTGLFCAEGFRTISTLLHAGYPPTKLFVHHDALVEYEQLQNLNQCPVFTVSAKILKKISSAVQPAGIFAIFKKPAVPSPDKLTDGIVLDHISDPGNMGTLIRTCAAMGKKTVIIIDGADVWSSKVIQATAGTIGLVTIFEWSISQLLAHTKNHPLYALVAHNGTPINQTTFAKNSLIVVGNEAHGISEDLLPACEHRITIPMPGKTESLNAAIAGAIALYEASKSAYVT